MTTKDLITTQRAVLAKLQDLRSLATANIDPRAQELTVLCAHAQQVLNKLVELYPEGKDDQTDIEPVLDFAKANGVSFGGTLE